MDRKYKQGKIYRIVDVGYNKCYYGSTTQNLSSRMSQHRAHYRRYQKIKGCTNVSVYTIFIEFDMANCKIELVELCPCSNKLELESREGYYIKNNECVNKVIPGFNEEKAAILENTIRLRRERKEIAHDVNKLKAKLYYESRKDDPEVIQKNENYRRQYKEDYKQWREINKDNDRNYMPGNERPSFVEKKLQKAKDYSKKICLILDML